MSGRSLEYSPTDPRPFADDLVNWMWRETRAIQMAFQQRWILEVQRGAPERPVEGLIARADGVAWDPGGAGKAGVYVYLGGQWRVMATVP